MQSTCRHREKGRERQKQRGMREVTTERKRAPLRGETCEATLGCGKCLCQAKEQCAVFVFVCEGECCHMCVCVYGGKGHCKKSYS